MIIFTEDNQCTGCSLCMEVCPKQAITMARDKKGFRYPKIDQEKCIDCELCKRRCPQNLDFYQNPIKCYGASIKDSRIRSDSSSGGVFWSLVELFIKRDGVIFGVKYDKNWSVIFDFGETEQSCEPFRISKYVEADNTELLENIKRFIKNGKEVLMVGTPCQIAAFRSLFPKGHPNLTLVDLVCNSVPSAAIWEGFIHLIEDKYGSIHSINLRAKIISWEMFSFQVKTEKKILRDRVTRESLLCNSYRSLFSTHLSVRPSCFKCKYKRIERVSDITIGDFWHIDAIKPEANDKKGLSVVLINTKKGDEVFRQLESLNFFEVKVGEIVENKVIPLTNLSIPKRYERFWEDFEKKNYLYVAKKYTRVGLFNNMKYLLGRIIKSIIKQ